jgi:hypothetical protein
MHGRAAALGALLALVALARGQEPPKPTPAPAPSEGKPTASATTNYENAELGLVFSGVYGWPSRIASASGAWTELARYDSDAQNDAFVLLLVRDNPYGSISEMRTALGQEFKESAEPSAGKPAHKEIAFRDVEMKRGINLPGVEVEVVAVELAEDGKRRERSLVVRTYYGQNRLFRVYCSARRARVKKVRDLFERAVSGLSISAVEEKAVRGVAFRSVQGSYSCTVPDGFGIVRPPDASLADARFESRQGIVISVISSPYDSALSDQIQELVDYYRDALKVEEGVQVFGGDGFTGSVTKADSVALIAGTVRDRRVYRVHTVSPPKAAEEAKRVHEQFLKGFRVGRQS